MCVFPYKITEKCPVQRVVLLKQCMYTLYTVQQSKKYIEKRLLQHFKKMYQFVLQKRMVNAFDGGCPYLSS